MAERRYKENRDHRFTVSKPLVEDPVLVVCPTCDGKSSVTPYGEDQVKCTCFSCGYTAVTLSSDRAFYWYSENPTDSYFGFDLWLQTNCSGNSLWAFNLRHLELLESYVGAALRERKRDEYWGWSNSSLASRLPKWLKSAKNREVIFKAINELKAKV